MKQWRCEAERPSDETTIQEFPAAEKILNDIENVIKKDPELTSFEIIPLQDNENRSPVYHEERSLGLASWCVQPLYRYAYSRLLEHRRGPRRREETCVVSRWLMGALLLNPDVSSFWNMRRELTRSGRLDASNELRFASVVLCYKAKCFEAFAYRRWLLRHSPIVDRASERRVDAENLLLEEMRVASVSADRYANNYHAWSHREYVLAYCRESLAELYPSMLEREWVTCVEWCKRHVSDHSGLAYRQYLLDRFINDEKTIAPLAPDRLAQRREFLDRYVTEATGVSMSNEIDSCRALNVFHGCEITRLPDVDYDRVLIALSYWAEDCERNEQDLVRYPGHEALWYHRRYLGHALMRLGTLHGRRGSRDGPPPVGLLGQAFSSRNEILASASRDSQHLAQIAFAEKFLNYVRLFCKDASYARETS